MPTNAKIIAASSVTRALSVIGDRWTLLILRDAFQGAHRFEEFRNLNGAARSTLTSRLNGLVENGLLERVRYSDAPPRFEYRLTKKGEGLLTVLTALREWSDEYVFGKGNEPLIVRDRKTGRRVKRLRLTDSEGTPLRRKDLRMEPGPGASAQTKQRFARRSATVG